MPPLLPSDNKELCEELQRVLRQINSAATADSYLGTWLVVRHAARSQGWTLPLALRHCLAAMVERLAEQNVEGAEILRRHYWEGAEVHIIARELAQVEGTVNKKQRQAIAQLATLLTQQEAAVREEKQRRIAGHLRPLTYTRLFGVAAQARQLAAQLKLEGPPWIIALDGLGGVGKSALADWLVRSPSVLTRWEEVAWVAAPRLTPGLFFDLLYEQMLAVEDRAPPSAKEREKHVRALLKSLPCLVVIDNLSSAELEGLAALLLELALPSKFLLTMRCRTHDMSGLFAFHLSELSFEDVVALLRWEAHARHLPALAAAGEEDWRTIYSVTGGNPLALRLVASHTQVHTLETVLNSLQQGTSKRAEALYTYIYRQMWDLLDAYAQQVLMLMPISDAEGADLKFLHSRSGMEMSVLHDALEQLVMLNLVDSVGSLHDRRYLIANLTRTFLRGQALRW